MPKLKEFKPKSFTDFVGFIEKVQEKSNNPLWYRGCGSIKDDLVPSLFRHKKITEIEDLVGLEYKLMTRFRQRSIPYQNRPLTDDWETLFIMQHYGIPTRLLDWTENPFIAFYFAVMLAEYRYDGHKIIFKKPAMIWILDPIKWNRHALRHESFDQAVLSTSDEQIKGYKPADKFIGMNDLPVAMYGAHNSPRIVAQRGVFVIFGQNMLPMEKLYNYKKYPENCLIKVVLEREKLSKMRKAILSHGITESVVFPDLEGLAKEIRRTFEFEV
jgi:hypothetical protein